MVRSYHKPIMAGLLIYLLFELPVCLAQSSATLSEDDQNSVRGILRQAYEDVKRYYYDPGLHGLDWEARFHQYDAMIGRAHNLDNGLSVIQAFLAGLNDSHTYFVPPARAYRHDSGYQFALVGDACFITQIRPNSDAATKLHIGEQIVKLNGLPVNRQNFYDVQHFFQLLGPRATEDLEIRSSSGENRKVSVHSERVANRLIADLTTCTDIWSRVRHNEDERHAARSRMVQYQNAAIWKLPHFNLSREEVQRKFNIARKYKALILDLRGDPGGSLDTLSFIVGSLFDHDIKIFDRVGRTVSKPVIATHCGKPFRGRLIVLVDSGSASAAELLARVIQLEDRGTIMGDVTSGAVMEANYYPESQGADQKISFGFLVSVANLKMTDGKSLEKTGVIPDEILLPTGADLAAGRDPVMARAAELTGVPLDSTAAGKIFPFEWAPI
ncbi:MAG: S41 family peptidase [Terracidiphilus sp.]